MTGRGGDAGGGGEAGTQAGRPQVGQGLTGGSWEAGKAEWAQRARQAGAGKAAGGSDPEFSSMCVLQVGQARHQILPAC